MPEARWMIQLLDYNWFTISHAMMTHMTTTHMLGLEDSKAS